MNLSTWLLHIKHSLPFNGDWLFPTQSHTQSSQTQVDLAVTYSDPERIQSELNISPGSMSFALILSEAERFAARADKRAEHVREKAKILLSTSTFIGAVTLGIISFFAEHLASSSFLAIIPALILLTLMLLQFGFTLVYSMKVMAREQSMEISTAIVIDVFSNASDPEDFKKRLAVELFATANQHEIEVNRRVTRLILGQEGFVYGLVYSFLLIMVLVIGIIFTPPEQTQNEEINSKLESTKVELVAAIITVQARVSEVAASLPNSLQSLQSDLRALSTRVEALSDRIGVIADRIKKSPRTSTPQIQKKPGETTKSP